jgi:hypothetical protein
MDHGRMPAGHEEFADLDKDDDDDSEGDGDEETA